ncbi:MAG: hypothetical protein CMQ50_07825, partial [Gammaproteobacteria bacterium]|nr:hypothetical protein [Gammaproteobacteria bacterium]
MAAWAKVKGIDLSSSADFTHPAWLAELEENFTSTADGDFEFGGVRFVLGTELSCVFKQGGHSRRVHLLDFAPGSDAVHAIREMLQNLNSKLNGDGRPTVGASSTDLTARLLDIDEACMVVPAHIWTPWYGMLGSKSGFEALDGCFGDMTPHIPAVETGLSSDPEMNWGVPGLAGKAIVSFSDAHSPPNMGRELTIFQGVASYRDLAAGLRENRVERTLEFFPEEGKYHLSGHASAGSARPSARPARPGPDAPSAGGPDLGGAAPGSGIVSGREQVRSRGKTSVHQVGAAHRIIGPHHGKRLGGQVGGSGLPPHLQRTGGRGAGFDQGWYGDLERVGGEDLAIAVTKVRDGQV